MIEPEKNAESECIVRYADTANTETLELPRGVVAEDVPFLTPVYAHVQGVVCCGFLLAPPFFQVEHNFPFLQYWSSQSCRGNARPPLFLARQETLLEQNVPWTPLPSECVPPLSVFMQ